MGKDTPPAVALDPTLTFMRLLWAVDHGLQSHSKRMAVTRGVTGPQRFVLRLVDMRPGIAPSEIAEVLHFDRSTVSGILRRLETRGLLHRVPDPADGRRVKLTLSPRGRKTARDTTGSPEERVRAALRSMRTPRVEVAKEVLDAIAQALQAGG